MIKKIEKILDRWTNINEILLHAGEMTAQERRTVLAVTTAMATEIRRELELAVTVTKTKEEIMDLLEVYYCGPYHTWPILLGEAAVVDGVQQFIVYPRDDGAITHMTLLFQGVRNVEVNDEVMGPIIAAPARPKRPPYASLDN